MKKSGFTLFELMVVAAIIAFLAMISVPSFLKHAAKAKRAEAYMNLGSLYSAMKTYYIENGKYTDKLMGADSLNWKPEGQNIYSYGFGGAEGVNYIKGKNDEGQGLSGYAKISDNGFTVAAVADIDADGKPDVITVDDQHKFTIVQDDLA